MTETDTTSSIGESLPETVSVDRLYRLLSHPYRRAVLIALLQRDEPMTLATLAEELADRWGEECDTTADGGRNALRISLYHVHAPKLAEADLIEFDPAANTVAPPEDDSALTALAPFLPSPQK